MKLKQLSLIESFTIFSVIPVILFLIEGVSLFQCFDLLNPISLVPVSWNVATNSLIQIQIHSGNLDNLNEVKHAQQKDGRGLDYYYVTQKNRFENPCHYN